MMTQLFTLYLTTFIVILLGVCTLYIIRGVIDFFDVEECVLRLFNFYLECFSLSAFEFECIILFFVFLYPAYHQFLYLLLNLLKGIDNNNLKLDVNYKYRKSVVLFENFYDFLHRTITLNFLNKYYNMRYSNRAYLFFDIVYSCYRAAVLSLMITLWVIFIFLITCLFFYTVHFIYISVHHYYWFDTYTRENMTDKDYMYDPTMLGFSKEGVVTELWSWYRNLFSIRFSSSDGIGCIFVHQIPHYIILAWVLALLHFY